MTIHTDAGNSNKGRVTIGYGYDLIANRDRAIADLQDVSVGVVLTPAQIAAIKALTKDTTGIPAALTGLRLPSEAAATALLGAAIAVRKSDFDNFIQTEIGGLPNPASALFSNRCGTRGRAPILGRVSPLPVR